MEILSIINIVIIKMQQWGCVCVCVAVYPFFKLMCGFRYFWWQYLRFTNIYEAYIINIILFSTPKIYSLFISILYSLMLIF